MGIKNDRAASGEAGAGVARPPVDLLHLGRQTMGDRVLESEVLALFVREAKRMLADVVDAKGEERRRAAHTLKGSASGVGAFAVADHAQSVEQDPSDEALIHALDARIREAVEFIAALGRGPA